MFSLLVCGYLRLHQFGVLCHFRHQDGDRDRGTGEEEDAQGGAEEDGLTETEEKGQRETKEEE